MNASVRYFDVGGCHYAVRIAGVGRPLLALHSLTSDGEMWIRAFARTAIDGICAIAPDARGHGLSSATPDPDDYRAAVMMRDYRQILDRLGEQRVTLIGFSMGARVATMIASRYPERVAALGVYGPPPHSMSYAPAQFFVKIAQDIEQRGCDRALADLDRSQPDLARRLRAMPPASVAPALGGFHAAGFEPTTEELAAVRAPTIVLGIENDVHPIETARFYADRIAGAEFRSTRGADRERDVTTLLRDVLALSA